jgi:hypothetical protein
MWWAQRLWPLSKLTKNAPVMSHYRTVIIEKEHDPTPCRVSALLMRCR